MKILGLDLSTSICGWAISDGGIIMNAGFFNISKVNTYKEKAFIIINGLSKETFDKVNIEETLSGFSSGFTSQQTLIKLVQNKSVICYILEEIWKKPMFSYNVNTMRKKVFGKARIKGIKPKEYVKAQVPLIVENIKQFERLNRNGDWDVHNSDAYDAIVCALYG
jgi:Holliday junction resolvasome RuvABC endonuclease subunit